MFTCPVFISCSYMVFIHCRYASCFYIVLIHRVYTLPLSIVFIHSGTTNYKQIPKNKVHMSCFISCFKYIMFTHCRYASCIHIVLIHRVYTFSLCIVLYTVSIHSVCMYTVLIHRFIHCVHSSCLYIKLLDHTYIVLCIVSIHHYPSKLCFLQCYLQQDSSPYMAILYLVIEIYILAIITICRHRPSTLPCFCCFLKNDAKIKPKS